MVVGNKAAAFAITSDEEPALLMLQWASVPKRCIFSAGVLGHYFSFGKMPDVTTGEPMLAKFKEAEDAAIVGVKQAPNGATYWYDITVAMTDSV